MSLSSKMIWMIERNLDKPLSLDEIAESCAVSKYHAAHAFAASTNTSVMQYVRARRLTLAAHSLAESSDDIIAIALDAGYGSHEAFTRAFKLHFDVTPASVRKLKSTEGLAMIKPAQVRNGNAIAAEPRIIASDEIIVAGLAEKRNLSEVGSIPAQWQKFITSYYADIPDKTKELPLSVTTFMDRDGNFIYLCGSAVTRPVALAKGLSLTKVPPQIYAVFLHSGHVSAIGSTYAAIFDKWLPENNRTMSGGPLLEKNMPTFDRKTGLGGIEIWIPLSA